MSIARPPGHQEEPEEQEGDSGYLRSAGRRTLIWLSPAFRREVYKAMEVSGASRKRLLAALAVAIEREFRGRVAEVWLAHQKGLEERSRARDAGENDATH